MRVLLLGGAGRYGLFTARRLVASNIVSEIAIAGRNQDALTRAVSELGEKTRSVQVDIHDERHLASVATGFDIVVNTAGPEWEVLLPGLRGTIAAGTHYLDLGVDGRTTERQLELDSMARERDIVAVLGMGLGPGLRSLLAVHASRRFDRVEGVQLHYHWAFPDVSEAVDELRKTGRVDASWQVILNQASGPVRIYRDGRWLAVDPLECGVDITLPDAGATTAYPHYMPEPITMPRYLPGVQSVTSVMSFFPLQLNELYFREGQRISRGELTAKDAAKSFLETIATDPDRWLKPPPGPPAAPGLRMRVVATGWKDGRRARYMCWPVRVPNSTSIPLAIATLRILRREVSARGVLPPEACFEPMPFFEEMAQYAKEEDRDKPLLGELLEWLP